VGLAFDPNALPKTILVRDERMIEQLHPWKANCASAMKSSPG
jgi:hypothetical protein